MMTGDADLSRIGELLADRARSRILLALSSGRELSASLLATEAGVSRSTASAHLRRLTEGGLITVRADGRNRHFRLAGPQVADILERLTQLSPAEPITSLRSSTRAGQLRLARTCYDHIAGRVGVGIMRSMLDRGLIVGGDGTFDRQHAEADHPAGSGQDIDYELTADGRRFLDRLRITLPGGRRRLVRYCVDWTETRHHLAGQLGRGIRDRFLDAGWLEPRDTHRALRLTGSGTTVLRTEFGLDLLSAPDSGREH
ncbi:ArsR/SmtB family transcription factor [Microlunatus soli]|uniref:DNA-binding transcriptional regulator, ArsR family n=1 Tax=Microlunatus soli TaxID=630515 RepID=A0A1H1YJM8_9ACTN|nr:metalloregulator ArsR/SmtB family transcription factor [Microlunatus soli]SDT21748.1 DNA-binding transcriptional regulator, ArsR family [Microlunatus soli]